MLVAASPGSNNPLSRPALAQKLALQADTGDGVDDRIAWPQRLVAPPLHHDVDERAHAVGREDVEAILGRLNECLSERHAGQVLFHVLCSHVGAAPIVWRGDCEVPRRARTVGGHARRRDGVNQRVREGVLHLASEHLASEQLSEVTCVNTVCEPDFLTKSKV